MSKAPVPSVRLKWKTDLEKSVVILNFERRGWQRVTDRDRFCKRVKQKLMKYHLIDLFLGLKGKETLRAKIANGIFIGHQVIQMTVFHHVRK